LDGARAYSVTHATEKHQLVMESDLGAGPIYEFKTGVNQSALPWLQELKPLLSPLHIVMGDNSASAGPDMEFIAKAQNFAQTELAQDASQYFDYHHSANDTLDKIDPLELKQNVAGWVAVVWYAAQAGVDFTPPGNVIKKK
jgi:carboxypeptidase Q